MPDVEPPEQHGGGTEANRHDGRRSSQTRAPRTRNRNESAGRRRRRRRRRPQAASSPSVCRRRRPPSRRGRTGCAGRGGAGSARPPTAARYRRRTPSPSLSAAGEVRVALRDEGDDRRGGETDPAYAPGQLRRQQVREDDAGGGEGDVGEAHQQQPAVRHDRSPRRTRSAGRRRRSAAVGGWRPTRRGSGCPGRSRARPATAWRCRGPPAGARSRAAGSRRSRGRTRGAPSRRSRRTAPAGRRTSP